MKNMISKTLASAITLATLAACSAPMPIQQGRVPVAVGAQSARGANFGVFNRNMTPQAVPHEVIVKVKPGMNPSLFTNNLGRAGARVKSFFDTDSRIFLVESAARSTEDLVATFKQDPSVEIAQPNYWFSLTQDMRPAPRMAAPNDELFPKEWHMQRVRALEAWSQVQGQGNKDLIVAVVDTGVDYNHPDLVGNVIKGKDFTGEDPAGLDPIDSFGHGTHVAGIIAAHANNQIGVAGVAPNVKILAVKVLSAKGGGSLFAIAGGIKFSVDAGAKIVNLSLGGPAVTDLISTSIGWWATRKGALLMAAAGNSANEVGTPARIDDYYMAVGATDDADKLAKFSCFGKELSVTSPGTVIWATTPTYHVPLNDYGYAMNYAPLQGTSMATPLAAGVAALVWSKHPEWTAKQVRAQMEKTSVDLGAPGKDNTFGHGRIDALAALSN
ncbi:MAG TPA: S8 family serine peptidase [Candidatus Obscuribacterales bacterium]